MSALLPMIWASPTPFCLAKAMVGRSRLPGPLMPRLTAYADGSVSSMRSLGMGSWAAGTAVLVFVYALTFTFTTRSHAIEMVSDTLLGVAASGLFAPLFYPFKGKVRIVNEFLRFRKPTVALLCLVAVGLVLVFIVNNGVEFSPSVA